MTHTHHPVLVRGLTPLNLATSAAYRECHGHHVRSGQTVMRTFAGKDRELPICARCGVPYGAPKASMVWTN